MLLALVGSIAWLAPPEWLVALASLVAVLAFFELATLCDALGAPIPRLPGAALTLAVTVSAAWPGKSLAPVLVAAVVIAAASAVAAGAPDRGRLAATSATVFAPIYLGLPLGMLAGIRWTDGREVAVLVVLAVVASDTSQYYAGRLFGRRPLAPAISPKKTIEGASAASSAARCSWWRLARGGCPACLRAARALLGLALVGLGILGDLFESMLKRAAAVKDSSSLIPGHGGVLDRIDALLLAAPVYVVVLRYGPWRTT